MDKGKSKNSGKTPTDNKGSKVGQLFPNASLEDYAKKNNEGYDDGEICDIKEADTDDEDQNSENEDCDDDDDNNDSNEEEVSE